ncbi:hypothetical protein ASG25_19880 [Rhizobium sp. Leaf384]|uniref:hypothetical protein n=1 Tax=unclassified Rhizobium TaxID=2613769 RepID=UPI000714F86B|nr:MULTISPECIES: hypothetical protein [unclassified Rhizobium]KQR72975.1 hypothetical protein ASG03_02185 [Rhizobium sp. Leaf341]KQS75615.1 hypothetical protein ASG25_19880 [Rhizobium sp. Leaf384]KQS75864.1 hypothetical protein ASG58_13560 [Rhizobium sp. Leaf383]
MHITRAQWLNLASEPHSLRRIYSLCLLVHGGDVFSAKERHLAGRLLHKLEGIVHLPVTANEEAQAIAGEFSHLETQVVKRLERFQPPRR